MSTTYTTVGPDGQPADISLVREVLDHGAVRLVSMMPMGGLAKAVCDAARVSHLTASRRSSDEALCASLIRRKHVSTLSHVRLYWEVKLPIFVARQWMRHWSWDYNEVSARYSVLPSEYYVPPLEQIGAQTRKEHQGRDVEALNATQRAWALEVMGKAMRDAFSAYELLIEGGVSREVARLVLPVSTYTMFVASCSLRDFLVFLSQRDDPHAQWEIREYAKAMRAIVTEIDPHFMAIATECWPLGPAS